MEDKNLQDKSPEEKSKKDLITEIITGRKLTPDKIARWAGAALICGAAFGIAAALTFCGINGISRWAEERKENVNTGADAGAQGGSTDGENGTAYGDSANGSGISGEAGDNTLVIGDGGDSTETGNTSVNGQTGGEVSGNNSANDGVNSGVDGGSDGSVNPGGSADNSTNTTGGDNGNSSGSGASGGAAGENAGTNHGGSSGGNTSGGNTAGNGSAGSGQGIDNSSGEAVMETYESFMELRQEAIEKIKKYMVSVSAISTGTTWFENEASSTETFAGVIISVGNEEVLILSTAEAAGSEALKVAFNNGVTVDAYVKQLSETDGLSVLAVSAVNGMEEKMLDEMESIEFAGKKEVTSGEPVIAAGAPLGFIGSYSFGDIGYINETEAGFDVEQSVFYAELTADDTKGTFIIDYEGRLVGVAAGAESAGTNAANADGLTRIVSTSSLLGTINHLKLGQRIAYTGVRGSEVSFDMRYSGIPEGMYVTGVAQDSPAYIAGIKRGDIITEVNGQAIVNMEEYSRALRKCSPGDSIELTVRRINSSNNYNEMRFTLTAGER